MAKQKSVLALAVPLLILFLAGCVNQQQQANETEPESMGETIPVPPGKAAPESSATQEQITPGRTASEDTALQEQKQRESFYNLLKAEYADNADKSFPGLQGICTTLDECKSICMPRPEVCREYCMKEPNSELCLKKHLESSKSPFIAGKCTGDECGKYCDANPQDPDCAMGKLYEPAIPNLTMPFRIEDYSPIKWGLWPFCVHGGDHPEGHGGIDFELKPGTKIRSSLNGIVAMTEDIAKESPEEGGGLAIQSEKIAVIYYGIVNRQVQKGQNVTTGQYIGDAVKLPAGEHFIHFEVNNFPKEQLECPLNYLDENFRKSLNDMHKQSHYPEIAQEPNLCNCESLPYKPSMTKGPQ